MSIMLECASARLAVSALVDSGLELRARAVVTTTWREWRTRHPETIVLSLETGHTRDYSEGAAYRDYFSNDRLMFQVPGEDDRLSNKDEVLVMRLPDPSIGASQPLAIAERFLRRNRVYHTEAAGARLVVVTSREGANRVFESGEARFTRVVDPDAVIDAGGRTWRVTEEALVLAEDSGVTLPRVPAQRAFWFGWHAQFPDTLLTK